MNNIYVLDDTFAIVGIVDEYVSCIWRPSYSEIGDFELYLNATDKAIDLLREGRFLVRTNDVSTINGASLFKKVMVIKNLEITTDAEDGDFLCVTGRELKFLLRQRIVWTQTTLTGTAENAIRRLITENAITPSDTKRVLPNLVLGAEKGFGAAIEKQVTGEYLDVAIVDICKTFNLGWDVYIQNAKLIVDIYEGVDRSYEQTKRPYVVFSEQFENLHNTEYQLNTEEYANTALIGGEGEGTARIYTGINLNNAGFARYETFVDARDISQNVGSEDEIHTETYLKLLAERGQEHLAGLTITEGFSGEVLSDVAFKYGKDFFLGDLVSVINKYGISKTVRVLSAIESEDENGTKLLPQFNI